MDSILRLSNHISVWRSWFLCWASSSNDTLQLTKNVRLDDRNKKCNIEDDDELEKDDERENDDTSEGTEVVSQQYRE